MLNTETLTDTGHTLDTLSQWVYDAKCADLDMDLSDFFVEAGRAISSDVLAVCESCPVRVQCVTHAFTTGNAEAGYFGGISPGQRRKKGLQETLVAIGAR